MLSHVPNDSANLVKWEINEIATASLAKTCPQRVHSDLQTLIRSFRTRSKNKKQNKQ